MEPAKKIQRSIREAETLVAAAVELLNNAQEVGDSEVVAAVEVLGVALERLRSVRRAAAAMKTPKPTGRAKAS